MMQDTRNSDVIDDAVRDAVRAGELDLLSGSRMLALHRRARRHLRESHGIDPTPGEIIEFAGNSSSERDDAAQLQLCLFY